MVHPKETTASYELPSVVDLQEILVVGLQETLASLELPSVVILQEIPASLGRLKLLQPHNIYKLMDRLME